MTQVEAAIGRTHEVDDDPLGGLRPALFGFCYRMLGSAADADDAVQETMVRAWRGRDGYAGDAPLEAWLYRIATNVCLNLLRGRRRRALPMDVAGASSAAASLGTPRSTETWVEPVRDRLVTPPDADPVEQAVIGESVRLAFVAALQLLPPRQRAVLILRDVLRWRAQEVAVLLDISVVSVKSALQRARATLAAPSTRIADPVDPELLDRYLDAFRRYDVDDLVALLHDEATLSMPPYSLWLEGRAEIGAWLRTRAADCANSMVEPIAVNGTLGFTQHRPSGLGGALEPFAVTVLESRHGFVSAIHTFIEPAAVARLERAARTR